MLRTSAKLDHADLIQVACTLAMLIALGSVATAQQPAAQPISQPVSQPTAAAPEKCLLPSHLVRFELVLGRLQLSPEYFRVGTAHDHSELIDGRKRVRSVAISVMCGKPTLQFQDRGGDESWSVFFKSDNVVDIVFSDCDEIGKRTLIYHQPSTGPVVASVEFGDGRLKREVQARSLWHIASQDREFFDSYLLPVLKRIDPSWDLARLATQAELSSNKRLHRSDSQQRDSQQVSALVQQLNSELAKERDVAFLALQTLGLAAETSLRDAIATDLTSHQRLSIDKLIAAMQPVGNDTPMRLSVWLATNAAASR